MPPALPILIAAALPIPDEAPVIITVRPSTASSREGASTSPPIGNRRPKARSVRRLSAARSSGFGGAIRRTVSPCFHPSPPVLVVGALFPTSRLLSVGEVRVGVIPR